MSGSRADFKAATEKASALEKQVKKLQAAAERAQETADAAEAEMNRYRDLDAEITRWRVAQVKKGASTKIMPEKLKARVDAKRAALEELEQARETVQAIEKELEQAEIDRKEAEEIRMESAAEVVSEMGDSLAAELAQINRRRLVIEQLLRGLEAAEFRRGYVIGWTELTKSAMNQPDDLGFPQIGNQVIDPAHEIGKRWRARLDAILADPNAEISIPKPLMPEDYIPEPPRKWVEGSLVPTGTDGWRPEQEQLALEATAQS